MYLVFNKHCLDFTSLVSLLNYFFKGDKGWGTTWLLRPRAWEYPLLELLQGVGSWNLGEGYFKITFVAEDWVFARKWNRKGEQFRVWWGRLATRGRKKRPETRGRCLEERPHLPLVAGVKLEFFIKMSKFLFDMTMFLRALWTSNLVILLNSGSRQTVSFFSRST